MEAPISASQGAMRSLPGKLESLLLEPPVHGLTKGEKTKIRLLKGDLEELIANYLMEPSEVDAGPALTANCWVQEVRELSYDIDDFVKELVHVDADAKIGVAQKTPCVKITRLRKYLNRRRWIADEISGFRTRVKEAIKVHRNYNLGSCSFRPWRTSDEHPPPPLYDVGIAGRLVHMDKLWDKLHGWLTDDGEQQQRVASIVGLGGVGKTTLAKQVYDNLGGRFECRAFVQTSPKADMRMLLTSMLSQLRRHEPPEADAWEVHHLIDKIRAHLIHKKYFIVIDDLWSISTWDIVSRALPDNPCGRILLTTEFDIVAQMCCGYNSKYIFKMEPLSEDGSRELFFSRAFGHQHDCPEQLNEVSYEIIRKCGGLPLATITIASLLASQPNRIDQWKCIQNSLSSNLRTDPTLEGMQQVLNVSYNNLPHHLKACMLYLSMYRESHIIRKNDLVKQWTAEDFISVVEGEDMEEIAGSYFDELVKRGMIQPVDINYNGEVLSCAVHYIVLNFIRYKSIEENFVTAIDRSQTNVRLTNKVRRLSLHFGDAEDVTPPSLRLSQVRSVGFFGLFKCMPSILEFNLLQVLILQLWGDDYDMSCNFTEISKLFRLKYLRIKAFHLSVQLPTQMQRLKDLVTLEIERRVTAVPSDIVDLPRLLHLSLPSETALPNGIGRMTSLRTLGYFNLSSNSKENVLNLGELTNLCDLRLTCSTVPSDNLENNMLCLSTILWKLSRLKSLTLAPEFPHTKTADASVSSISISCDGLGSVSSPPTLLQRLDLLPRICIFSSLPEWIRKLDRLSILKIAVRGLSMNDIDILKELLALTALSLYVRTAPVKRIVFDKAGFPILKYLKFMCTAPCLAFEEGAMPNVRRLKLGSNAHGAKQYGPVLSSIKYLLNLEEITLLIGGSDRTAAKLVLRDAISKHPSTPIVNIRHVNWIFYCEEEKIRATQEKEQPYLENQYENVEVDSDHLRELKMAGAMVSATKSLMSPVIDKLTGLLGDEYKLVKSVKDGIEFLRRELSTMDAALERLAGMEEQINEQMKEWRNKVRELSYDIEDCIDRFMHRHSLGDAKSNFVRKCVRKVERLRGDRRIAKEIQELKALVVEECERRKRYNMRRPKTNSSQPVPLDPQACALYEEAKNLVGIDGPREEIIGWLKDEEKQPKVVSIFGIGGLGKTTLAMEVYHKIDESFHCRASVSGSRTPDIKKLLRDILFQINKEEYEKSEKWEEQQLIRTLREYLEDKRYFIIVDDIWSIEAWEHLKSALPVNNNRSRIITTTRIKSVAESCCSGIVEHMYEAKPLDEGDSQRLFFRRIFGSSEDCPQELTEVANEILRKCGGFPLAILSIASLLASKSQRVEERVEVWKKIRNSISSSVEKDSPFDKMKRILLLSYFDLPHHLKTCLLYLSVFPEDYSIDSRHLIWAWVSEGLIPGQNRESMEQLGKGYLNELINRSMIQPTKTEADGITVKSCRVHDIIHDFIISKASEENFVNIFNGNGFCGNSTNKIRRLSLQPNFSVDSEMPKAMNMDHLRSLHMYGSRRLLQTSGSSRSHLRSLHSIPVPQLSKCQVLRVLNIEDTRNLKNCHIEHIGSFSLLKHLRITGTSISKLPEQIGNLQYLEILDVRGNYAIDKLPATIVQLQKLVRLFVDSDVPLPDGIGNLRALEELSELGIYKARVSSMQELGKLTKLRTLEVDLYRSEQVSDLEDHEKVFISSLFKLVAHSLQSLRVGSLESSDFVDSWVFSRGSSPPLQRLVLDGIPNFAFPNIPSQIGSLANLTYLSISRVRELGEEGVKILASLPALLFLTLYIGYGVRQGHVIGSQGFQCLVELNFCGERCLMFEPEAMPKLQRLNLKLTRGEQYQPGGLVQGLHHLSSLKHMTILLYCVYTDPAYIEALEDEIRGATSIHPNRPILEITCPGGWDDN